MTEIDVLCGIGVPEPIAYRAVTLYGGDVARGPGKHLIANRKEDVEVGAKAAKLRVAAELAQRPENPFQRSQRTSKIRVR